MNPFMVATKHPLTLPYVAESAPGSGGVLEAMHVALFLEVTRLPGHNILEHLGSRADQARQTIVDLVLATDLAKQGEILSEFQAKQSWSVPTESSSEDGSVSEVSAGIEGWDLDVSGNIDDRTLLLKMLIKAADVSNPAKSLPLYLFWTNRILEEFYDQGDEEKRTEGIPVTAMPQCDRSKPSVTGGQKGFISFVVTPIFEALAIFSFSVARTLGGDAEDAVPPVLQTALENIESNLEFWGQVEAKVAADQLSVTCFPSDLPLSELAPAVFPESDAFPDFDGGTHEGGSKLDDVTEMEEGNGHGPADASLDDDPGNLNTDDEEEGVTTNEVASSIDGGSGHQNETNVVLTPEGEEEGGGGGEGDDDADNNDESEGEEVDGKEGGDSENDAVDGDVEEESDHDDEEEEEEEEEEEGSEGGEKEETELHEIDSISFPTLENGKEIDKEDDSTHAGDSDGDDDDSLAGTAKKITVFSKELFGARSDDEEKSVGSGASARSEAADQFPTNQDHRDSKSLSDSDQDRFSSGSESDGSGPRQWNDRRMSQISDWDL
mmetsp:Transcript_20530/g.42079  ORF Transcript_20530/g.42079 Transcript_20530/m.42079 type:complete len:550 (-) Transcript_20530:94-1743(-)